MVISRQLRITIWPDQSSDIGGVTRKRILISTNSWKQYKKQLNGSDSSPCVRPPAVTMSGQSRNEAKLERSLYCLDYLQCLRYISIHIAETDNCLHCLSSLIRRFKRESQHINILTVDYQGTDSLNLLIRGVALE